ncbi:CopG family transcriptional regulator [Oscillatoria sp. FACHB-1406]|uniref:CopG family transcriptional regulator n=1 Tax=Oscillatoria sp. FACHB-1406 TaxID=2692846 RepID=UPI0016871812|nr:CopG family transcriptional regulator [Oscillatoria sp. FACHB-1406]MBD2577775.1 CopG family transcriptional regulator [Oscillatoria sp. FACHB-1406]
MKRFSLRMTKEEYEKVKGYCDRIEVSMNDVIRQLIRDWQPDRPPSPKQNTE